MSIPSAPNSSARPRRPSSRCFRRFLEPFELTEPQWVTLRLAEQLDGSVDSEGLAHAVAERAHFRDAAELVVHVTERGLLDHGRPTAAGRERVRGYSRPLRPRPVRSGPTSPPTTSPPRRECSTSSSPAACCRPQSPRRRRARLIGRTDRCMALDRAAVCECRRSVIPWRTGEHRRRRAASKQIRDRSRSWGAMEFASEPTRTDATQAVRLLEVFGVATVGAVLGAALAWTVDRRKVQIETAFDMHREYFDSLVEAREFDGVTSLERGTPRQA